MILVWKNETSYSRDDVNREPRTWAMNVGAIKIIVTRRHGLDGWWLMCEPFYHLKSLGDAPEQDAKTAALKLVEQRIDEAYRAIKGE